MKAWRQLQNQIAFRQERIAALFALARQFPERRNEFVSRAQVYADRSVRVGKELAQVEQTRTKIAPPVSRAMSALLARAGVLG